MARDFNAYPVRQAPTSGVLVPFRFTHTALDSWAKGISVENEDTGIYRITVNGTGALTTLAVVGLVLEDDTHPSSEGLPVADTADTTARTVDIYTQNAAGELADLATGEAVSGVLFVD